MKTGHPFRISKRFIFILALSMLGTLPAFAVGDPALPLPYEAGAFSLKLEPGVTFPLNTAQTDRFDIGGGLSAKALLSLTPWLDMGPSLSVTSLPSLIRNDISGTAWTFGGSLQAKRPHDTRDNDPVWGLSPWLDIDGLYVRSGPLDRPGFSVGVGAIMPLDIDRVFWVGPFARYLHVLHMERGALFDKEDAQLLTLGLTLEVAPPVRRQSVDTQVIITRDVVRETERCADTDGDGIPDAVDRCPDIVGVSEEWGCQIQAPPLSQIEINEIVYFAFDEASLLPSSLSTLNKVAATIETNRGFMVQIEGHTSSEGTEEYNQVLSERRASTVLEYLVNGGIARERLRAKGFTSSKPVDTNATEAGREKNRRVEFKVSITILKDNQ